jgi:hypothetical protein
VRKDWLSGKPRPGAVLVLAAAAFILAVTLSVIALTLKRDALAFHSRDYNYFIEMAARLADPGLTNRYSTNIEGYNLVGLQGIEGVKSIYQAIHTEYYRWVNVLLYTLFRGTLPIYLLISLLSFVPVLYAVFLQRKAGGNGWAVVLFILLFVLFPGAVPTAASDLRSRVLYASAWSLAVMAVYFDRPWAEKLVFLAFLPFIREDGILLGAIVTGLNFVRMRGKPGRGMQTLLYLLVLSAALAAFSWFMAWGGYTRVDTIYNPLNILAGAVSSPVVWGLGLLAASGLGLGWRVARRDPRLVRPLLFWVVYSAVIALAALQLSRDFGVWYTNEISLGAVSGWDIYRKLITWEQTSLLYSTLILPVFLLGSGARGAQRGSALLRIAATALCAGMALTTLLTLPAKMAAWQEQAGPAQLVWNFKHGHDRYRTRLLVDFPTLQAFYDYETVVVYNRLPVWMVYPNLEERFYPQDKELAARAIAGGLEYAVIARESLENVRELAHMAGRELVEVESNERYMILQIR